MDNSNQSRITLEPPMTESRSDGASGQAGEHLNRFLLCTLVSRTARQIRATAERNGERVSLLTVTRNVLRSALRGESLEREPPVTSAPGLDPFDELCVAGIARVCATAGPGVTTGRVFRVVPR